MNPVRYARAHDADDAIAALRDEPRARFIAGGTTIVDLMKETVEQPDLLIDINALPFASIAESNGTLEIGSLARMSDVADHPAVMKRLPAVSIALNESASPQLRNMASIGGNIMQRTRCAYFRDVATACNKRAAGAGCSAIDGVNRGHAILGGSNDCICVHASDLAVALRAFDATVTVNGPHGTRTIPIAEFYVLPKDTPHIETVLKHGELIERVSVPLTATAENSTYLKVRDRAQYEFALVSVAAGLDVRQGVIQNARIALGGVAPVPWRVHEAETALAGKPANADSYRQAAATILDGAHGYGDNDFKITLARSAIVRALSTVGEPT
jgi:xanthine dehydrogenase YagS FAD-binding subunit